MTGGISRLAGVFPTPFRLATIGRMDVLRRGNVKVEGRHEGQAMVLAHGFGCDQAMWRYVVPAFEDRYRVVLFDHVGAGRSDLSAYADDLLQR